jgi:hypothetical protein
MDQSAILLLMQAKPGKEEQVERLLKSTEPLALAEQELGSAAYFAFRLGAGRFGIFVTSRDEQARDAQRRSAIAAALFASGKDLFEPIPIGENVELLVAKLPGESTWMP